MPSYVIAGASRGLGLQFIKKLASDPSNTVVALARTPSAVQPQLEVANVTNVTLLQGDITSPTSLQAAAATVSSITKGKLDYLIVNGAFLGEATGNIAPLEFKGPEKEALLLSDVDIAFKTNFAGPLFVVNAFLDLIRKGDVKKIVVVSSGMAEVDFMLKADVWAAVTYSASKAASNVMTAKLAIQLKEEGIIVVALSPGLVDTQGTPEAKQRHDFLKPMFQKYEPTFEGPLTTEQSVDLQLDVIKNLNMDMTGKMWSHLGTQRWL